LHGWTSLWIEKGSMVTPVINRRRAVFVLGQIDEILSWEKTKEQEKDVRFVELGEYLCEVRAKQYWRLDFNAATTLEATSTETLYRGIQTASPTSAGTGWLALSELRCVEKLTSPSSTEKKRARGRCYGKPDHTLCALPQGATRSCNQCPQCCLLSSMAQFAGGLPTDNAVASDM
jgi:hypothetical protein